MCEGITPFALLSHSWSRAPLFSSFSSSFRARSLPLAFDGFRKDLGVVVNMPLCVGAGQTRTITALQKLLHITISQLHEFGASFTALRDEQGTTVLTATSQGQCSTTVSPFSWHLAQRWSSRVQVFCTHKQQQCVCHGPAVSLRSKLPCDIECVRRCETRSTARRFHRTAEQAHQTNVNSEICHAWCSRGVSQSQGRSLCHVRNLASPEDFARVYR